MNNFKARINKIGLSYKIEMLKFLLINTIGFLLLTILFVFYRSLYMIITVFGLLLTINYFVYSNYKKIETTQKQFHIDEFAKIIAYFEVFVGNGFNVYTSFSKIIDYASPWMKHHIEALISNIDDDKTVRPFITFSNNFEDRTIENVMISIYQMIEEGGADSNLSQFKFLFDSFSTVNQNEKIEIKKRKLDNLNALPLIGAGIVTAIVIFGVITIVGDLINVL